MDYRSLPRRYRPKRFQEVLGQQPVITTLKNALMTKRLGHAYLFAGMRGTGKTTIARIFAKGLNCDLLRKNEQSEDKGWDGEPCNLCPSCISMQEGTNLDFIEIDGASHRGIDDIRNINETVGYAASAGKYKIYLIDEVHMLTKEAFNALLKTLEEPPENVLFFFATTEPQKVLPTILSRCQRFLLQRISKEEISLKLQTIAENEGRAVEKSALDLIASRADGSLRDAESFLDQFFAFQNGLLKTEDVENFFGVIPKKELFKFDLEAKKGNLAYVFSLTDKLFREGKDFHEFLLSLVSHIRGLLTTQTGHFLPGEGGKESSELLEYRNSAQLYTKDQLLYILDMVVRAQEEMLKSPSPRIFLESLLLRIVRSHYKMSFESLVERLEGLEKILSDSLEPSTEKEKSFFQEKAMETRPKEHLEEVSPQEIEEKVPTPTIEKVSLSNSPQIQVEEIQKTSKLSFENKAKFDTAMQFAAVEFEGTLEKHK